MKVIHKYNLSRAFEHPPVVRTIHVAPGAKCLSVHEQKGELMVWAVVDEAVVSHLKEPRRFAVLCTGQTTDLFDDGGGLWRFLGTVVQLDGNFVEHVFEQVAAPDAGEKKGGG